jgi:hypothetical protein
MNDLIMLINDKGRFRHFFNREVPLSLFLKNTGYLIACPFHEESVPSAKIYEEENGGDCRLFCFGCRKTYRSYDYVRQVLERDPAQYLMEYYDNAVLNIKARDFKYVPEKRDYGIDWVSLKGKLPDIEAFLDCLYFSIPLGGDKNVT